MLIFLLTTQLPLRGPFIYTDKEPVIFTTHSPNSTALIEQKGGTALTQLNKCNIYVTKQTLQRTPARRSPFPAPIAATWPSGSASKGKRACKKTRVPGRLTRGAALPKSGSRCCHVSHWCRQGNVWCIISILCEWIRRCDSGGSENVINLGLCAGDILVLNIMLRWVLSMPWFCFLRLLLSLPFTTKRKFEYSAVNISLANT